MINCFWAYSNHPYDVSETVINVINQINKSNDIFIKSWEAMNIQGHFIIDEILKDIDECDVFICELSNLNLNVLFEVGYAIAKKKKIRVFLNENLKGVKDDFKRFNLLSTVGYTNYINSSQIISALWELLDDSSTDIFSSIFSALSIGSYNNLLYIKGFYDTDSSLALTRSVSTRKCKLVVDDPKEVAAQTLDWYICNLITCNSFLSHLQSNKYTDITIHNAKISLVSGIALGLDIPFLMLAESPFESPIDYKNIVKVYSTKNECVDLFNEWYETNKDIINAENRFSKHTQQEMRAISNLQNINLGENLAENESEELLSYFVKTSSFYEALNKNLSIFIGRKGTGKTANLLSLAEEYNDNRNHVCVIKPIGYEIEGVLETLQKLTNAERGFLIESIWKYLIYTELLKSIYNNIKSYPLYKELNEAEHKITEFVEQHNDIILPEFSARLEKIVSDISNIKDEKAESVQDYQWKVSELLHNNILNQLRSIMGDYCVDKKKVIVLIDNLDKAWQAGSNIEMLSNFLFGLLDVGTAIIRDFAKENNWKKPVNLSLIIFLREDIFALMDQYVPERDKLQVGRITWEDKEVLLRVIEERIESGNNVDIWSKYFCKSVNDEDVKDFITSNIIPRPRDIITLVKRALGNAVSRQHILIDERDLLDALTPYSKFALDTLISEMAPEYPQITKFLYELAGEKEIIKRSNLKTAMRNSGIKENDEDQLISMLCKMSFLGLEVKSGTFEFCYNEDHYRKYDAIARKNIQKNEIQDCRYKIHRAFHTELMIES